MMFGCVKNLSSFDSSQPEESELGLSISFVNTKNTPEKHNRSSCYLFICLPISSVQYSK